MAGPADRPTGRRRRRPGRANGRSPAGPALRRCQDTELTATRAAGRPRPSGLGLVCAWAEGWLKRFSLRGGHWGGVLSTGSSGRGPVPQVAGALRRSTHCAPAGLSLLQLGTQRQSVVTSAARDARHGVLHVGEDWKRKGGRKRTAPRPPPSSAPISQRPRQKHRNGAPPAGAPRPLLFTGLVPPAHLLSTLPSHPGGCDTSASLLIPRPAAVPRSP